MLRVGITGGIGSGKSLIAALLELKGYPVYNTDFEAKRLCNESAILKEKLTNAFGKDLYKNNVLDKFYFAQLIFNDKDQLQKANSLIHPEVTANFLSWAKKQNRGLVFVESAILFDSELQHHIDKSIVVTSPLELRINRVCKRDQVDLETCMARINNQLSEKLIIQKADHVIYNDDKKLIIPQLEHILSLLQ